MQNLRRRLVGDAENVARRAEPRRIHGDGIGDDGDEAERALGVVAVKFLDDVRVDRISRDDAIRLRLVQNIGERIFQPREIAQPVLDELVVVQQRINPAPKLRDILHHVQVGAFGKRVERAVAALEQVEHLDLGLVGDKFERVAQTSRGGVVAFAETRREDEDFFHGKFLLLSPDSCYDHVSGRLKVVHNCFLEFKMPG